MRPAASSLLLVLSACALDLDPPPAVIHARFDPVAEVVPMPTDILRDRVTGHLALPIDDSLSPAERELYEALNQMDGWSSASAATVAFDGVIDTASLDGAVEVWRWDGTPTPVSDTRVSVTADGRTLTIDPARTGWARGATYLAVLRGGPSGARGTAGERLECDAAFYFLRQTEPLDTPEHERAFPGATVAERREAATRLEVIRQELAPMFDFVEARGLPRAEVAALWSFTVTERVELAIDEASQRLPLPIDLMIDPLTGRIDAPRAPWDSETVVGAKARLAELDGAGTSANLLFELTGAVDPATVNDETVELWQLPEGGAPRRLPAAVAMLADGKSLEITPVTQPLAESARHALVVRDGLRDADGGEIALMPAGHLLLGHAPVVADGKSQVAPVADDDAVRLESVRAPLAGFLGTRGRQGVLGAWTFTTMTVRAPLADKMGAAAALSIDPAPTVTGRSGPVQALLDFPLAIGSLLFVDEVVHGTLHGPIFLDPETRAFRPNGDHHVEELAFTATVPGGVDGPMPVVIFGHAVMTERRMVLALGDALAARGIASIAIDLPYHGTRTYCWSEGPLTIPDPRTGELTPLGDPCTDGAACLEDGRCVADDGTERPLRQWIGLPMARASGAAFLEIDEIAHTRDHLVQAQVDMTTLLRSLLLADWSEVFGAPVAVDRIGYAGQSLGGIVGATFVAMTPSIDSAVINVAGGDTVDMFDDSPFFGAQIDAFFLREGVSRESYDGHRFLNVARWLMDTVDPASVADTLVMRPGAAARRVLIQMATLDFIIPNAYTEKLEALSGAGRRDYVAEHGFLVIPIEPEYLRGTRDVARFFTGELEP